MYHAYWRLNRPPFASREAAPLFYEGESQLESLARLRFVARQRQNALMVGERGAGKSTLLGQFAAQCRAEGRDLAAANLAGLSAREFLWNVAAQLSLGPRPDDDAIRLFRRLADHAAATRWRNASTLLLLDDADQAGPDVHLQLSRLLSLSESGTAWLTLIMASTPSGVARLGESLLDAIDLRIDAGPWNEAETIGYIQHALLEAGADQPIFEDEALSTLYSLTDGLPRRVNRLADHALLGAAAEGLETVDAGMIEAAHEAISWTATA